MTGGDFEMAFLHVYASDELRPILEVMADAAAMSALQDYLSPRGIEIPRAIWDEHRDYIRAWMEELYKPSRE
jgi:hypothetical protein